MKLKALDTLHVSSVQADNLLEGEIFEVSDYEGLGLVARGYAVEVKGKASHKKKADAPDNKMQPITLNKADAGPKKKGK